MVTVALLEGQVTPAGLAKVWVLSYLGNLAGSLLLVAGVTASSSLNPPGVAGGGASLPFDVAVAKTSLGWGQAVAKGVLANWLVCIAVFHATASTSLPGKTIGLWGPIMAFVAIGLEHSGENNLTPVAGQEIVWMDLPHCL